MKTFTDCVNDAKQYEDQAKNILEANGWHVEDLRDDVASRKHDIDFRAYNDDVSYTIEIKGSPKTAFTHNITVEYSNVNNISRDCKGWFYYCEADYVGYVYENAIHIVSFEDLQKAANSARRINVYDGEIGLISTTVLESQPSYIEIRGE